MINILLQGSGGQGEHYQPGERPHGDRHRGRRIPGKCQVRDLVAANGLGKLQKSPFLVAWSLREGGRALPLKKSSI